MSKADEKRLVLTIAGVLAVFGLLAAAYWVGSATAGSYTWPAVAGLLLAAMLLTGALVKDGLWGLLVDDRKVVSLSRLQMLIWTVIVGSAYLTMFLLRQRAGMPNPASVDIPAELLALIGIGTTSLVGSPLVRSTRANVYVRKAGKPSLLDVFKGESDSTHEDVDLAKVQMFFFTLIAAIVYCAMLYHMFQGGSRAAGVFPKLDDGFVWLLGISNGGYLVNKGIPRNGSADVATRRVMQVVRRKAVPRQLRVTPRDDRQRSQLPG